LWENTPTHLLPAMHPSSLEDKEEEEKRRRAALAGLVFPLLSALADAPPAQIPLVPGTPQIGQVASIQNVPNVQPPGISQTHGFPAGSASSPALSSHSSPGLPNPGSSSNPGTPGSGLHPGGSSNPGTPGSGLHPGGSSNPGTLGSGLHPGHPGTPRSTSGLPGCLTSSLLVLIVLFVILASIITLGLTVWEPALTLNGNAFVVSGSTLSLHGTHFLPNSNVDLTLDNTLTPIYYLQRSTPNQLAALSLPGAEDVSQLFQYRVNGKQTVIVAGSGTFAIVLQVDSSWKSGQHTLPVLGKMCGEWSAATFTTHFSQNWGCIIYSLTFASVTRVAMSPVMPMRD
jgi:hypothetical protein